MTQIPDGLEVVATHAEARDLERPPFLVIDAVRDFLDERGLGAGELEWERIGEGQSNITYRITRGDDVMVLRRGPRPPHPRSAHDMVREAKLQKLLREAGVKVPRILAICEDDTLRSCFLRDGVPRGQRHHRRDPGVALLCGGPARHRHCCSRRARRASQSGRDPGPLAAFGRPTGYLERQVTLFSSLWEQNTRRDVPEVAAVGKWLAAHVPQGQGASVVHGDFRLGNLMYVNTAPATVAAVLDWEMATLGDPLADLGYFTATYTEWGSTPTVMDLTPVTRQPGYPTRAELIDRYQSQMPLDLAPLPWYQTLALWKSAIFCEAMYTRWLNGERPGDTFAASLAEGVPRLLAEAADLHR